jgi:hypothetical protein
MNGSGFDLKYSEEDVWLTKRFEGMLQRGFISMGENVAAFERVCRVLRSQARDRDDDRNMFGRDDQIDRCSQCHCPSASHFVAMRRGYGRGQTYCRLPAGELPNGSG